jgi:phosphoglycerate dehydrogenase-like enzyme
MEQASLFVLVGLTEYLRDAYGVTTLHRLEAAHPRVRVRLVVDADDFAALLPKADGVIAWSSHRFPASVLAPGGRLRWIHSISAGVDWLLMPEVVAAEHVALTSMKGPMGPAMAEHVALLMLALARDFPGFLHDRAERRWTWGGREMAMTQLFAKTIAILGVGAAGGNLARLCQLGFGMRVLGMARMHRDHPNVDRYFDRGELPAALAEADFVALCLAQTADTEQIIDAAALAAMKPSAYLINVARGRLVDEEALIEALRAGQIAGAGLDVAAIEPLSPDSPLWTLPNVILTPHVAPGRDLAIGEMEVDFMGENIRRFAESEPLRGLVDRWAGY